ncbi:MAG TPA: tol-pal system protein YbgF [Hyphomicrobiaceae bacterium]|nr:tol-pal system protein YbgF [Hyphomicrobiaceae bacterium]
MRRIEQLEEQFVDLQVMVGTLETLARAGAGAPAPLSQGPALPGSGFAGQDSARIEALETQVRALTAQLEQLSEYVRSLDGHAARAPGPAAPFQPLDPRSGRTDLGGISGSGSGSGPGAGIGSFGTTVTTGGADPIGEMLSADPREEVQTAALDPPSGGSPKQLYERAYGLLLQQNYAAAEAGFEDFLKRYPNDELAANAQYWLGETYYVRGQYKAAASAFLKVSRSYAKSAKAPDSMLKLAMSLDRLGQRDAACQAYSELGARYPNPPAHVRERAQSERQRAGCR